MSGNNDIQLMVDGKRLDGRNPDELREIKIKAGVLKRASGSAYVYQRDEGWGDNWGEVRKITASDGAYQDLFGGAVSISGDTAAIGVSNDDDDGNNSGSVYVYVKDGSGNWNQQAKLTADGAAPDPWLGEFVSISGDTVVIGRDPSEQPIVIAVADAADR